jgi:hypothetical protein
MRSREQHHDLLSPGVEPFGGPIDEPSGRGPWFAIVSVVTFSALLLIVWMMAERGRSGPEAADVIVDDRPAPTAVVDAAAPHDGTESLLLPVQTVPDADLLDGQQIEVFAQEFPPHAEVALVQCSPHAGANPGIDRCMVSTFERAVATADGRVHARFTVWRILVVGDQQIDCAGPPPDGHVASCSVAVGMLSDYDVSGTAPIHFDPSAELAAHPSVELSNRVDLEDYELVTITIRNPGAGSRWHVNQCVIRANPSHCGGGAVVDPADPELQGAVFSPDGSDIVATVPIRRMIDTVDCGREPEACSLVAQRQDDLRIWSLRLSFRSDAPLAPAELVLVADGPVQAGARVAIEIRNRAPGQLVHPVLQCPAGSVGLDGCVPVGLPLALVAAGALGEISPVAALDQGVPSGCTTDGACVLRILDPDGTVAAEAAITVAPDG